ncbi:MAG: phosphatidate cytidylyltransferase [Firmicutes bacterium]|nr:phosphatidate cytidylyltransferase [Bacillota bacterium]
MKTRIISGLLMAPLLVIVVLGGWFLWAAALLIALVACKEFFKGFEASGTKPSFAIGYTAIAALFLTNLAPEEVRTKILLPLWFFLVVVACMVYGFKVNERKLEDMTSTALGIMYTGFLPYHIVLIDHSGYGAIIWLVFLAAFGTDIMAYFTGMALGKHKLCPNLSPKKSVEGAVGGVAGSVILCAIFAWIVDPGQLVLCLAIGFFGSIVAQLGDLSASAFKRQMGIKDYGNLIPGHGGILDRFDSVFFTGPMVYYVTLIYSTVFNITM